MIHKTKKLVGRWWRQLKYDPSDPNYYDEIKTVAIGGGTGLSNLLEGIKHKTQKITAIVTVCDDGSSSGEIRKEFKILPPGDFRKCLAALSRKNGTLRNIFEYRFKSRSGEGDLNDHAFGNIWLAVLTEYFGSFEKALEESGNLLDIIGNVYPSTLDRVDLVCNFRDGKRVIGESKIAEINKPIEKISLTKKIKAYDKSIKAIEEAELIVIGPGSLYTSIIPNLLVPGIVKAIRANKKALKIFVCNISTERGETENLSVEDHVKTINRYAPNCIDQVIVNSRIIKKTSEAHKIGEINNITYNSDKINGIKIVLADVIDKNNPLFHDNQKLAKTVIDCYNQYK